MTPEEADAIVKKMKKYPWCFECSGAPLPHGWTNADMSGYSHMECWTHRKQ